VNGAATPLQARRYQPIGLQSQVPILVYYHGGGFALGSIDSHDSVCRFLAEHCAIGVVSVGYRLAPEHPFPAAIDDAVTAYADVVRNASAFGSAPHLIAVGGDSAGGNLAATVAHAAVCSGLPKPLLAMLLYPVTDFVGSYRSRNLFANDYFLDEKTLLWYRDQYMTDPGLFADPRASVVLDTRVHEMPPTFVFTAGFDPFRDEGVAYAGRLRRAGVRCIQRTYEDQLHGFASLVGLDRSALAAMREIATLLRGELDNLCRSAEVAKDVGCISGFNAPQAA
jgi:acetyl esterase